MRTVMEARRELVKAGLPTDAGVALPHAESLAADAVEKYLQEHPNCKLSVNEMLSSATDYRPLTMFFRGDSRKRIIEGLRSFGEVGKYVHEIPEGFERGNMGIIRVDEDGRMYLNILPRQNDPRSAMDAYHQLSKGSPQSHTFVREPGRFWKLVEAQKLKGGKPVENDVNAGQEFLRKLRDKGYESALLDVSEKIGSFAVSFSFDAKGRMSFFHPLAAK